MRKYLPVVFTLVLAVVFLLLVVAIAWLRMLAALWIPLSMVLLLLVLPVYAVTAGQSMLEGLFDIELSPGPWLSARPHLPVRLFFVTLAAYAVAGTASATARLALLNGPARFHTGPLRLWPFVNAWIHAANDPGAAWWLILVLSALAAWVAGFAIAVSRRQDPSRSLGIMLAGAGLAIAVAAACSYWLIRGDSGFAHWLAMQTQNSWLVRWLGCGYAGPAWTSHVQAWLTFLPVLVLYIALGWYGYKALGKSRTIPALIAVLMALMIMGWIGSSWEFFLGRWHTPLLLVIAIGAVINKFILGADHTYKMVDRGPVPAPSPYRVLTANHGDCTIVVASAGGGIQSAAWTALVLDGLSRNQGFGDAFRRALCLISSISGGSLGSACFVNRLGNSPWAVTPFEAASASSLDEVAWGLAWPDLWRLFFPWPCGKFIDRAGAMERAWIGNATCPNALPQLKNPLSSWNQPAAQGSLPAVIMNSTIVEVGGPVLFGTSDVNAAANRASTPWKDGDEIHVQGKDGEIKKDIPVVRAARLSATFPYVTPVARPYKATEQPHMIDGGFYDTYGMATLTEWLDQALQEQHATASSNPRVQRVLVVQIDGFPPDTFAIPPPSQTRGGWLLQLLAPVQVLLNARSAGQVSHRDIELTLLQEKWANRGVEIKKANFDFDPPPTSAGKEPDPPLSWHLMPTQIKALKKAWESDPNVLQSIAKVADFLAAC